MLSSDNNSTEFGNDSSIWYSITFISLVSVHSQKVARIKFDNKPIII